MGAPKLGHIPQASASWTVQSTLAVFSGSSGSRGGGLLDVLTAQKRHPRVQVSPISIIVAVAVCPSPPPQHVPMLGQRASSHTVCNFSSRSLALMAVYFSPAGTLRFSQSGFLAFSYSHPGFAWPSTSGYWWPLPRRKSSSRVFTSSPHPSNSRTCAARAA